MLERLVYYASRSLPSIIMCFIGITAIKYGFKRFGLVLKIQLWLVFLVLLFLGTLSGFLFGVNAVEKTPAIALPVFLIGILFWIVSIIFGRRKKVQ